MPGPPSVSLSQTCIDSLIAGGGEEALGRLLVAAIVYFLAEGSGEAGHAYPEFRREDGREPLRELELDVPAELWRRFAAEADRQRVAPERLLEHAAFYLAAQADAGRLAERIAEDLGLAS